MRRSPSDGTGMVRLSAEFSYRVARHGLRLRGEGPCRPRRPSAHRDQRHRPCQLVRAIPSSQTSDHTTAARRAEDPPPTVDSVPLTKAQNPIRPIRPAVTPRQASCLHAVIMFIKVSGPDVMSMDAASGACVSVWLSVCLSVYAQYQFPNHRPRKVWANGFHHKLPVCGSGQLPNPSTRC